MPIQIEPSQPPYPAETQNPEIPTPNKPYPNSKTHSQTLINPTETPSPVKDGNPTPSPIRPKPKKGFHKIEINKNKGEKAEEAEEGEGEKEGVPDLQQQ